MSNISQVVDEKERQSNTGSWRQEWRRLPTNILGIIIYCIGVNIFLRPLHLYSGGFMGFAQLFDTLLRNHMGDPFGRDISGVLYYILNIPALVIAYKTMRRKFVIKTILTVTGMTLLLTVIPIPDAPVLEETIANCMVAGILSGSGIGLILRAASCDGGMDIIGMILIQVRKNARISVGQVSIVSNCVLYGICMLLFDVPTVIYSLISSVISSFTCDKVHTQNINMQVLIVTKMEDVTPLEVEIMGQMTRGITRWQAQGGYTQQAETILMTIISKYEITQLRHIVHQIDPHAFVMIDEGVAVDGNYLKKIT